MIASRGAPIGFCTDTGGSCRIPASLTGMWLTQSDKDDMNLGKTMSINEEVTVRTSLAGKMEISVPSLRAFLKQD